MSRPRARVELPYLRLGPGLLAGPAAALAGSGGCGHVRGSGCRAAARAIPPGRTRGARWPRSRRWSAGRRRPRAGTTRYCSWPTGRQAAEPGSAAASPARSVQGGRRLGCGGAQVGAAAGSTRQRVACTPRGGRRRRRVRPAPARRTRAPAGQRCGRMRQGRRDGPQQPDDLGDPGVVDAGPQQRVEDGPERLVGPVPRDAPDPQDLALPVHPWRSRTCSSRWSTRSATAGSGGCGSARPGTRASSSRRRLGQLEGRPRAASRAAGQAAGCRRGCGAAGGRARPRTVREFVELAHSPPSVREAVIVAHESPGATFAQHAGRSGHNGCHVHALNITTVTSSNRIHNSFHRLKHKLLDPKCGPVGTFA